MKILITLLLCTMATWEFLDRHLPRINCILFFKNTTLFFFAKFLRKWGCLLLEMDWEKVQKLLEEINVWLGKKFLDLSKIVE